MKRTWLRCEEFGPFEFDPVGQKATDVAKVQFDLADDERILTVDYSVRVFPHKVWVRVWIATEHELVSGEV